VTRLVSEQVEAEQTPPVGGSIARLSGHVANSLRYWEPRRLIYNGVLALVVVAHFVLAWPGSRDKLSLDLALTIFVLAVLANVCYCAAYVPDVVVQFSGLHQAWRTGRMALLAIGTAFAATITHFFAKGIFGG
jgi:hypothetical protein